jgi:DNA-binding transcriptional regulator YdaS (Cro superfamily)
MEKHPLRTLLAQNGLRLADLARKMGLDKSTMTRWDHGRVPAERVLDVERATGVSRHDLRPDIYPRDGAAA